MVRLCLWIAGGMAMLAGLLAWAVHAQPYPAPWAWLSFIAMCVIDDVAFGAPHGERTSELPRVGLLAAVIVFRRHPELTLLVATSATLLGSLIKRERWVTGATSAAQRVLAAVLGSVLFRLVGFEDTEHFVAATLALVLLFAVLGPGVGALLRSSTEGTRFWLPALAAQRTFLPMAAAGVLLALAWRTPATQAAALKLGDFALIGVLGLGAGALVGGRVTNLLAHGSTIPLKLLVGVGAMLLLSQFSPGIPSWLLPITAGIVACVWALRRRLLGVVIGGLGMLANETVRALNGGRMPVDLDALPAALRADYSDLSRQSATYVIAGPDTRLGWLADRFPAAPFPGVASLGDILIAAGTIWLIAALMVRRPAEVTVVPESVVNTEPEERTLAA